MAGPQPSERAPRSPTSRSSRSPEIIAISQLTAEIKSTIRILIVDDERTLRESCASVLQYEGYQVSLCSRGEEAKDLLKHTAFDIVLLDLYMSDVPGMRLLRTCLDAHPDTIAIMITGNPSIETSLEALRAGAWDYIPKPFSATHLQILIGRAAHAVMVARESHAMQEAFAREHGNSELVEAANGGTLLLDELVEMPKPIQAKLLRVIQDGVLRRVGSENTDAVVNVRFIAATNGNPEDAVEQHVLREDLYYRLRVVPIHVPALRERPSDIALLAEFFLARYWARHRGAATPLPQFSDAAVRALRARPWKGNVRELQNVVEHMVVLLEPAAEIRPEDIPALGDRSAEEVKAWAPLNVSMEEPYYAARDRLVAEFELHYLTQLLTQAGGNMSRAARVAGVDRTTLYRLMERHGLDRKVLSGIEPNNGDGAPPT